MTTSIARILRASVLVTMAGGLAALVFTTNCGGSSGGRPTGAAGTTGNGTGTAGTQGSAGTNGGAGVTGTAGVTGSGGRFACAAEQALNCSAGLTLSSGHVTTFSPEEWSPMDGKYCNASGLRGSIFSYSDGHTADPDGGVMSSNAQGVDAPAGNFRLSLTVGPGGWAGGGISFDHCVNASSSGALKFTAWIASGDLTGCIFKSQLQTFAQRPTDQFPPGGCDPNAGSCYNFPSSAALTLSTTPTPFTVPFSMYTPAATPGELVGLQWLVESGPPADPDGGAQTPCTVEIRIDDIDFVAQ
jgi:hypothetical protein